jgi:N-acetylmuramoyl-L-alanine amidase
MPSTAFRLGDRHPAVAGIRERLHVIGLLDDPGVADPTTFDRSVDDAVRHFQQQRGITVDGVVGPLTVRRLDEAHWRLGDRSLYHHAYPMMRGDDVAHLQQRLSDMGFDPGRVDGIYGPSTESAVREFQRNVGLPVDGTCGPQTTLALQRLTRTVTGGAPGALRERQAFWRSGPTLAGKVVVVDPGHGGGDDGFVSPHVAGLTEADIAYDVASRVEGRLTALGVTALLTRGPRPAGPVDEDERADFANRASADLVVSIHVEQCPSPVPSGVATYFFGGGRTGEHSAIGQRLAEHVQHEIVERTDLVDGRTHAKTWELLRQTRMPAVRVELGYVSNAHDAVRLSDAAFRDVLAEAIVVGLQRLVAEPADEAPAAAARR